VICLQRLDGDTAILSSRSYARLGCSLLRLRNKRSALWLRLAPGCDGRGSSSARARSRLRTTTASATARMRHCQVYYLSRVSLHRLRRHADEQCAASVVSTAPLTLNLTFCAIHETPRQKEKLWSVSMQVPLRPAAGLRSH